MSARKLASSSGLWWLVLVCFDSVWGLPNELELPQRFDRFQVYQVVPETQSQLHYLQGIQNGPHQADKIIIMSEEMMLHQNISIAVDPTETKNFLADMLSQGIEAQLKWRDLQKVIDLSVPVDTRTSNPFDTPMSWDRYHRYATIELYLRKLAENNPDIVTLEPIGISYEGRTVWIVKLTNSKSGSSKKPVIWMDAGIHAREWISVATMTYMIDQIVTMYKEVPEYRWMLDQIEWQILPVINTDGYEFTFTNDRLWRKTRKISPFDPCIGVDANRNYDFMWQTEKPEMNPCSLLFGGDTPISEPENVAVWEKVLSLKDRLAAFMTFHSYGQLWMAPYGYTAELPPDYADMYTLAINATNRLKEVYGTTYEVGTSAAVLYTSSGTSRDFAKGRTLTKYVFTVELRDDGEFEFLLPPDQILPTAIETFEAVKVVAEQIAREFGI